MGGIETSAPTFAPGSTFAGYRIEAVAGRGGMGIVYRATQVALGRPVALKLIAANYAGERSFRERFKREWETAASIDHPNVIPLYEAGAAEEHLFIAMRFVEGVDLAEADRPRAGDRARARGPDHRPGRLRARRRPRPRPRAPRRQARQRADRRRRPRLPDRLRPHQEPADRRRPDRHRHVRRQRRLRRARADPRRGHRRPHRRLRPRLRPLPDPHPRRPLRPPVRRREDVRARQRPTAVGHRPPPRRPTGLRRPHRRAMAKEPADRYASAGELAREATATIKGSDPSTPKPRR